MVDIGFWEFMMVGVVALIVVGPERLPGLARTAGLWIGKARYFVSSVKAEIDREIKADALKRMIEEQARIPEIHEFIDDTRQQLNDVHETFRSSVAVEPTPSPTTPIASGSVGVATDALDHIPEELQHALSSEPSEVQVKNEHAP